VSLLQDFARCTRKLLCPVCGKHDWCMVSRDDLANPSKVICKRVESKYRWGEAGWMHRLRDDGQRVRVQPRRVTLHHRSSDVEWDKLQAEARAALQPKNLEALVRTLDVLPSSLDRLGVGCLHASALAARGMKVSGGAWTFPMRDGDRAIVGIRLRLPSGAKLSVTTSRVGLFIPDGLSDSPSRLLITEGESDCAAMLDLGLDAVGRPSCSTGGKLVLRLVQRVAPHEIVIMADNDDAGRDGARDLVAEVRPYCSRVRVVHPPRGIKDAREWKRQGATREVVEQLIDAAPLLGFSVTHRTAGG
jgi:Toprim-like